MQVYTVPCLRIKNLKFHTLSNGTHSQYMWVPPAGICEDFFMILDKTTYGYLPCKSLYLFAGRSKWLDIVPYLLDVALKYLIRGGLPGRHLILLRGWDLGQSGLFFPLFLLFSFTHDLTFARAEEKRQVSRRYCLLSSQVWLIFENCVGFPNFTANKRTACEM